MKWTDTQQKAISSIGQNILVSASAGAGKTTILIERLMKRIMVDRISVDEILALTFTEAAAAEMKYRLQSAMNQRLRQEKDAFLEEQLSQLQTAQISTIHSFCLSIVQNYSYVITLDPVSVNNLLDEATKAVITKECLDQVITHQLSYNTKPFLHTAQHFSARSHDFSALKNAILTLNRIASAQTNPDEWYEKAKANFQQKRTIKEFDTDVQEYIWQMISVDLYRLRQKCVIIQQQAVETNPSSIVLDQVLLRLNWLNFSDEKYREKDYDGIIHGIEMMMTSKLDTIKDNLVFTKAREELNGLLKQLIETGYRQDVLLNDIYNQSNLVENLIAMSIDFSKIYRHKKNELKCIDFDDMEKFAYEILNHKDHEIAAIYKKRFKEVMIDEFQDTNEIQHAIINKVAQSNNVFRVGDVKQSIYKFRGARPQLMRQLQTDPQQQLFYLSHNYRSKRPIVEFNNFVFNQWMNIEGCEDTYSENDHVSIGDEKQNFEGVPVFIDVIDLREDREEETAEVDDSQEDSPNKKDLIEFEESTQESLIKAQYIAKQMIDLHLNEGIALKDMVVLVRSHQLKQSCKDAFNEVGLPYFIDTKSGFYQSEAVQHILNLFRWINQPRNEIALTGVLLSPFFNKTIEEVALCRIASFQQKNDLLSQIEAIYPDVASQLHYFKSKILSQSVVESLSYCYQYQDFYQSHCDNQGKTNLDFLLDKAEIFDHHGQGGLYGFMDMIEQIKDEKSSEAIPVGSDEDVVRVLTIHQSKGLQFPVVFYWASNRISIHDLNDPIVVDQTLGLGLHSLQLPLRIRRSNLLRQIIEHKITLEELQEQMRILYVALTRAQNRLICVGAIKKDHPTKEVSLSSLMDKKGSLTWLTDALQGFENPSYLVRKVSPLNQSRFLSITPPVKKEIPRFSVPSVHSTRTTPSLSTVQYFPTIDLNRDIKPKQQGSIIHNALKLLSTSSWHKEDIIKLDLRLNDNQIQQLLHYRQNEFTQWLYQFPIEFEMPFIIKDNEQITYGFMDMVVKNGNSMMVIDFKTDRNVTKEMLNDRHSHQLKAYQNALNKLYPDCSVKAYIYSFYLSSYILID